MFPMKWKLDRWSAAVLISGLLAIFGYCFFASRHRILWSDELFSWVLVTDPSFAHMVEAWRGGVDGGGFAFYLLCRFWLNCFGQTHLAYRAFSAAGSFVGLAFFWFVLRKFYPAWIAALTIPLVWFGSYIMLWQLVQTRFYGLMLAAVGFILWAVVCSAREADDANPGRRSTIGLVFLGFLLLVNTHPLGIFYSAAIVFGCLLSDAIKSRWRPLIYAAAILAGLTQLLSLQALRNSNQVGKPWFWTTRPTYNDLLSFWTPNFLAVGHRAAGLKSYFLQVALALLLLYVFSVVFRPRVRRAFLERSPLLFPALAIALSPLAIFLISRHGTSIFVDRYLIPATEVLAIVLAEAITAFFDFLGPENSKLRIRWIVALGLACAVITFTARESFHNYPRAFALPPFDYTSTLVRQLPAGVPVVIVRPDVFDVMLLEGKAPNLQLFYLLDWQTAISPASPRGLVSGYHELDNLRKFGYMDASIQQANYFLAATDHFFVLSDDEIPWLKQRILNDPAWEAQRIGSIDFGFSSGSLWEISRSPQQRSNKP